MKQDINYYLSKGFDLPMAEYYASGRKRIVSVSPDDDFTLILTFDNGEQRKLDCKPMQQNEPAFAPFRKRENFNRVYLDENHCVSWDIDPNVDSCEVWSNKIDLDPDVCYVDSTTIPSAN